jgi:hypothetical protein
MCAGCVWVAAESLPGYRRPIDRQEVKSIVVGVTTRQEILARFGEPQDRFENPTVFLYRWGLAVNVGGVMPDPGPTRRGLATGVGGMFAQESTLHIVFRSDDTVAAVKFSAVDRTYPW